MFRSLTLGLSALSLVAVLGCGSDLPTTVPVTGTIKLDGEPVEGATVTFLSQEGHVTAGGTTDAQGKFTLKTFIGSESAVGAVPGKHEVAVTKTDTPTAGEMGDPKEMLANMTNPTITSNFKPKHLVPERYNNPTMSKLTADVVEGGTNDFTFELTK